MPYAMRNGKWRGTKMIQGRVKTKSFATKAEAKKWEAEQTLKVWEAPQTPTACWIEFANDYLTMAKERFADKTWKEKKRAFKLSMKAIPPDTAVDKITAGMALEALRRVARQSGYAANKVRKNLAAAWAWGRRYSGLPQLNPFLEVEKFPADKNPRYVPPEADFWRVYDVACTRDKVFLLFLLHTGARRTEAFRLEWEDIDFTHSRLRLGSRKTASHGMEYHWLPMTSQLHAALLGLRGNRPKNGIVFTSMTNGEAYTARQHMMPRLCEAAGVKPFGFHAIRHLYATIMAYGGLELPVVQRMLRHQSPTTTARYIGDLGVQNTNVLEDIFARKERAGKILPFPTLKKAICT